MRVTYFYSDFWILFFIPVLNANDKLSGALRGTADVLWRVLIDDWPLKALALIIALGLWYGVTGARAPATIHLRGVQLAFRLPNDLEVGNEPRSEVEATLTGSRQALDRLNVRDLVAYVDVSDRRAGERIVRLTPDRVHLDLPEGVRVEGFEPAGVPLRLEPRIEREVPVRAELEGKLPDGYELRRVIIVPEKVRVRGPASHVAALAYAPTETILLDGLRQNFSATQMALDIADPRVTALDASVNVQLEIGERRVEKVLTGVSVRAASGARARPAVADVTLYGPASTLGKLRAADVALSLETVGNNAHITPRLVLPPGTAANVELRFTSPSNFSVAK